MDQIAHLDFESTERILSTFDRIPELVLMAEEQRERYKRDMRAPELNTLARNLYSALIRVIPAYARFLLAEGFRKSTDGRVMLRGREAIN